MKKSMDGYKKNSHAVYDIKYHVIWVTKYRYKVLSGQIAYKTRKLIRQGCEARGITILQGSVGKDHIHLLISCRPSLAPSKIMQYLICTFLSNHFCTFLNYHL
ncbi:IS200/IS605 family transposase [Paraliobacillus sp. JSM ZJ581]|uniref:IS200/IS605 family transposase n=1 Tax=Paraliobacillus sp. JSM ZJ581 TaxID=3342118 RepID=UPI0035A88D40